MLYYLFGVLDWIQARLGRVGVRFQWPCWLIDRAWHTQATPCIAAKEN